MYLKKRFLSFMCILLMVLVSTTAVFANDGSAVSVNEKITEYDDVAADYWAYDAIKVMSERKIMEGNGKGLFNPESVITRAQFSKILVVALDLKLKNPNQASFKDVKNTNWAFSYVETAKSYLTGFRISGEDYFKPDQPLTKEDMAVALVKALGYGNEAVDASVLSKISDKDSISSNLKDYVVIAISHKMIDTKPVENSDLVVFEPKKSLTRASVAVLLKSIISEEDDKITYDEEEKVTYDESDTKNKPKKEEIRKTETYVAPKVSASIQNHKITLKWQPIKSEKLQGYKVVISKNDSSPKYPENGYLYWITDRNKTSAVIDNKNAYNGGDFGKYLTPGTKYYFSVTAVYNDRKVRGNVLKITYPVGAKTENNSKPNTETYAVPKVSASIDNNKIILRWQPIKSEKLQGYKVVISKSDSSPKYPENGYLYWITDRNKTTAVIDNKNAYNGGDFDYYLNPGQKYYFSVTAVYSDRKVAGNVLKMAYPASAKSESTVSKSKKVNKLTSKIQNGKIFLNWNKVSSDNFCYYKVVISKNNANPKYPEDGYLYYFTDVNQVSAVVDNSAQYNGGDFGGYLKSGKTYYFSITAVYNDSKVPGNVIRIKYP